MSVQVIYEPAPPPRVSSWGKGKLEVTVRLMDSRTGKQVGENHSARSGVNERQPNFYKKY